MRLTPVLRRFKRTRGQGRLALLAALEQTAPGGRPSVLTRSKAGPSASSASCTRWRLSDGRRLGARRPRILQALSRCPTGRSVPDSARSEAVDGRAWRRKAGGGPRLSPVWRGLGPEKPRWIERPSTLSTGRSSRRPHRAALVDVAWCVVEPDIARRAATGESTMHAIVCVPAPAHPRPQQQLGAAVAWAALRRSMSNFDPTGSGLALGRFPDAVRWLELVQSRADAPRPAGPPIRDGHDRCQRTTSALRASAGAGDDRVAVPRDDQGAREGY